MGSIDNSAQGWSKLIKLNKRLLRKSLTTYPLLDSNGILQFDNEVKSNIFADSFVKQFKTSNSRNWVNEVVHDSTKFYDNQLYNKTMFFSPGKV